MGGLFFGGRSLDEGKKRAKICDVLPGGVIGNTRDFGSLVQGSSPCRVNEKVVSVRNNGVYFPSFRLSALPE